MERRVGSKKADFLLPSFPKRAPQSEGAIAWNDPQIGIDWRLDPADVLLSEKDSRHPRLDEAPELFDYNTDYYAQR